MKVPGHSRMPSMRRQLTKNRGLALAFLAFALLIRAMVPAGMMPVATSLGLSVQICSGQSQALTHIVVPLNREEQHKRPSSALGDGGPCPFAGLNAHAFPSKAPVFRQPGLPIAALGLVADQSTLALDTFRYRLPPSQGPPLRL